MNNEDPDNTCAFCLQPFESCHCDEVRQLDKDDDLFPCGDTPRHESAGNPLAAERSCGRRPEEKIPTLPFGEAEKMTGGGGR